MSVDPILLKCLDFAIKTEAKMSLFYNQMALEYSDDKELMDLLLMLSMDEAKHQIQFRQLKSTFQNAEITLSPEEKDYLLAMLLPQKMLDLAESQFSENSSLNRNDLMLGVFQFEKETLRFFKAIMEITGENPVLRKIIDIEKKHVLAAMKIIMTGSRDTSLEDSL